jgi:hypothetical protein
VSNNHNSALEWLSQSSLQIISAVIGSGLLVALVSAVISEINQPHINLNITPHFNTSSLDSSNKTKVDYYEVFIRNDGKTSATNLTLSMYFFGNILDYKTSITAEEINLAKKETDTNVSLLVGKISRLAPGAMVAINIWTDTSRYDPYFISTAFDQGSAAYPVFNPSDIESGRFPNILAGQDDSQLVQKIIVTLSILCIISFVITIIHKKIRTIMKTKRVIHPKLNFDLYVVIPIAILASIFIWFISEELPLAVLTPSLIIPPLDVTEGPSINTTTTYKDIEYTQGQLLLYAAIFWSISFSARSVLTFLIVKFLIAKLYQSNLSSFNHRFIGISSVFIMGTPIDSTITLFMNKLTYSISPIYFFSIIMALDIARILILVLILPRILVSTNLIFYYTLSSISIVSGLLHITLFFMCYKILTNFKIDSVLFSNNLLYVFLILGLIGISRLILTIQREKTGTWIYTGAIISIFIIIIWGILFYYITTLKDPLLFTTIPLISLGILIILLEGPFIGITRLVRIRKIFSTYLKIDNDKKNSSSKIIPIFDSIKVHGSLGFCLKECKTNSLDPNNQSDNNITIDKLKFNPLDGQEIIFHDGEGRKDAAKLDNVFTDKRGKFESQGIAPSTNNDEFKIRAHFRGKTTWKGKVFFTVEVLTPADSEVLSFITRLHKTSISVLSGIINTQGKFERKSEFKLGETITFWVSLLDEDTNQPILGEDTIKLRYNERIIDLLPTNEKGETIITIESPPIISTGWTYQVYYPGSSLYAKSYSQIDTFRTK